VLLAIIISIGMMLLIRVCELITEVRSSGLFVRFHPFQLSFKPIDLTDLVEIRVRTYRAMAEFCGWGRKIGWKGNCYTVSGNLGVDLIFAGRRPLLIGSKNPQGLAEALGNIWGGRRVDLIMEKKA
jgi:hypothetical protein